MTASNITRTTGDFPASKSAHTSIIPSTTPFVSDNAGNLNSRGLQSSRNSPTSIQPSIVLSNAQATVLSRSSSPLKQDPMVQSPIQQPVARHANGFRSLNNGYHPAIRSEVITPVGRRSESVYNNMGSSPATVVGDKNESKTASGTENDSGPNSESLNRKAMESEKGLKSSGVNGERGFAGTNNAHFDLSGQAPMSPYAASSGIGGYDNGYDQLGSQFNPYYHGSMPGMTQDFTDAGLVDGEGTLPYVLNHDPPTYTFPRVGLGGENGYHASPTATHSTDPSSFGGMAHGSGPTSQFVQSPNYTGQNTGYNYSAQAFQPVNMPSPRSQGFLLVSDVILGRRGSEQVTVSYHQGGMDTIQIRSLPMPSMPSTEELSQGGASLHIESWDMYAENLQGWARSLQSTCLLMQLANPGSQTRPRFSNENGVVSMIFTLPHHAQNQQRIDAAIAEGDRIINHRALNRLGSNSAVFGIEGSLNGTGGTVVNNTPSGTKASGKGKATAAGGVSIIASLFYLTTC